MVSRRIVPIFTLVLFLLPITVLSCGDEDQPDLTIQENIALQDISFVLDNVQLTLSTPFLPNQSIVLPEPDDSVQVANLVQRKPTFQSLTLTAIPFGSKSSVEVFPVIESNKIDVYRDLLAGHRQSQGGTPQAGPIANLFGQDVISVMSTVNLFIDVFSLKPVRIVEWVVEAGNRLWVLRVSQEIPLVEDVSDDISNERTINQLTGLSLSGTNLTVPSISVFSSDTRFTTESYTPTTTQSDLPFPSWWDGECDINNYEIPTGIDSFPLGGSFRGVKACGPRPWVVDGHDFLVSFFPGAWGVLEWQCVELSMRFLHLAYGIAPYQANGNQVVPHYSGDKLIKINNGVPGYAPQPNDIMSSGPESPWGHTSVVIESNVNDQGNGTITILEENSSSTGVRSRNVTNWEVEGTYTVIGWLHEPDTTSNPILYFPLVFK
jgi:hypothetical protein